MTYNLLTAAERTSLIVRHTRDRSARLRCGTHGTIRNGPGSVGARWGDSAGCGRANLRTARWRSCARPRRFRTNHRSMSSAVGSRASSPRVGVFAMPVGAQSWSLSVVVMPPLPAVTPLRITITVHAVPSPCITLLGPASWASLIPVVVILLRIHSTMVFRERVAGVNTVFTVVVSASTKLSVAGSGRTKGQHREQDSKKNRLLHFQTSIPGCLFQSI